MNIQTLEKKRKVELNLKEESECNQKKPKFALDNGDDWYPVWIILKDWALKNLIKSRKKSNVIKIIMMSAELIGIIKTMIFGLAVIFI